MRFEEFLEECSRAQIVVLGPQRAGKTSLVYSVSHLGKTLGIEAEEGVHAAADYINADNLEIETFTKKVKKDGRWIPLPPDKQPPTRERTAQLVMKAYTGGYDFVVVDSLTEVAGKFENEFARKGMPEQRDWYKIIEGMKMFVDDLKNGNFHLLCTCIAAPPKEGSMIEISPSLPGQLREQMLGKFQSIVLMSYNKKEKKRMLVVNDPARGLCDRFHSFGDAYAVDVTHKPLEAVKTLIEGATGGAAKKSALARRDEPVGKVSKVTRRARPIRRATISR